MKRQCLQNKCSVVLVLIVSLVVLCTFVSCVSSSVLSLSQFSLDTTMQKEHSSEILTGSVSYGAGFYFPNSSDILDISLLKKDSTTGVLSEISHQRIRNIQRFPLQFTVRYDGGEISDGDSCTLYVTLTSNDAVSAQGFAQLQTGSSGFEPVSIVLQNVT